jgi:hypothetical protein
MVLNATFNNIYVILWLSVLLGWKLEYPETTIDLPQVTDKHYVVSSTHRRERDSNSQCGLLVPECIIRLIVSAPTLTWFIRYIVY